MTVVWEWGLNLAVCRADDFIMKPIKNHDAYSSRLSRSAAFLRRKQGERVGKWMDG